MQLFPGAVLHGLFQALVERLAQCIVTLADDEAGRCIEARNIDRDLQRRVTGGIVLCRLEIEEMGIDRAVVKCGNGRVVVRELHEIGAGKVLFGIDFLQRALHDTETLALEARCIGDAGPRSKDAQETCEITIGEINGLLALDRRADCGGCNIEAAVGDRGHQGREFLAGEDHLLLLETKASGDIEEKLDVEAGKVTVGGGEGIGLGIAHRADTDGGGIDEAKRIVGKRRRRRACKDTERDRDGSGTDFGKGGSEGFGKSHWFRLLWCRCLRCIQGARVPSGRRHDLTRPAHAVRMSEVFYIFETGLNKKETGLFDYWQLLSSHLPVVKFSCKATVYGQEPT
ncbi:hypothetical protein AGR4C_Lc90072 [Agrobacterium tumefaciens str. Kerr 14]|uniref:Uncharacterized protein n=1 Tax=Agrobacterium tumefaciens str. Kerr 14 TaxID=1183424 RepID=A0A1S7S627_AGRTU|nr:hypothetical protein AGR4C_Lc90072 [Agrobacterium tumefaciens str. Kerr 14]